MGCLNNIPERGHNYQVKEKQIILVAIKIANNIQLHWKHIIEWEESIQVQTHLDNLDNILKARITNTKSERESLKKKLENY